MATLITDWSLYFYWLVVLILSYRYVNLDVHMCFASMKENYAVHRTRIEHFYFALTLTLS